MPYQRTETSGSLRLDRVLASQPELGPSIPDGGYGWIILAASLIVQVILPSILSFYGVILLFLRLEGNFPEEVAQDGGVLPAAVLFVSAWTAGGPAARAFALGGQWPRLLAVGGTCLSCAGLLLLWVSVAHSATVAAVAGALSGLGACSVCAQADLLVRQYFRRRLAGARTMCACARQLGFVLTPAAAGAALFRQGVLRGVLVYQAAVLQLLWVVLPFRKPAYLKAERRRYQLVRNILGEEEMVYENGAAQEPPATEMTSPPASMLARSFAEEFPRDLGPVVGPTPIPVGEGNEAATGEPPHTGPLSVLRGARFYLCWAGAAAADVTQLAVWTLLPSLLYREMDALNVKQTAACTGVAALGGMLLAAAASVLPPHGTRRRVVLAQLAVTSATGCAVLSLEGIGGWALLAATLAALGTTRLSDSVSRAPLGEQVAVAHWLLATLSALPSLSLLLGTWTFAGCFRLAALLNLLSAALLLAGCLGGLVANR